MIWAMAAHGAEVDGHAEVRVVETMPGEIVVDDVGTTTGWGPAVDTRVRLGGGVRAGDRWRAEVEADVLSGQLLGATWDMPDLDERGRETRRALTADGIVPREAFVGARLPWFDVELGLVTSNWGLGLVANDGATDPWFGRSDFGDRTFRARLATKPIQRGAYPLYVIVAADRVLADDLARIVDGDVAWQGVAAALYADDRTLAWGTAPRRLGAYGVVRDQQGGLGHLRAHVVDLYADWSWVPGPVVRLAAEGAVVVGRTDVARTYAAPDELPVRQAGFVVQSSVGQARWTARLDAAYASGDAAPDDGVVNNFRFDRDYAVGMVLFDELAGALDLGALREATDPALAAYPPEGVETLAAEGAVHQAFALQPAVAVTPLDGIELRGGVVLAWSTAPIAQPFQTFRSGGAPTNHAGLPTTGRYLGTELDWAVATREVQGWRVRPQFELMGGHARPSRDLTTTRSVNHLLLIGRIRL